MEKRKQYAIIVKRLFLAFVNEELPLPKNWQKRRKGAESNNELDSQTLRMREISDYLSGMTDNFAKDLYKKIGG